MEGLVGRRAGLVRARQAGSRQGKGGVNMDCLRGALQGDYLSFVYKGGSDPGAGWRSLNACTSSRADAQAFATKSFEGRPKLYSAFSCRARWSAPSGQGEAVDATRK